ncbi:MAG: class I SAM-dependent methyltransferase [Pyrinomonadaceae bacterium]
MTSKPKQVTTQEMNFLLATIQRRWRRTQRRRAVGRAYDMALEIACSIPMGARVLDVGCGNGFIAHHLIVLRQATVVGLDVEQRPTAMIDYLRYNGRHFPFEAQSFDAILLCYVLHHAQDCSLILGEVGRVLRPGGLAVVYEDIPAGGLDRAVCWVHNRQWQRRSGPCTFRLAESWRRTFRTSGFDILSERPLSRWRNFAHPVSRRFYVLQLTSNSAVNNQPQPSPAAIAARFYLLPT